METVQREQEKKGHTVLTDQNDLRNAPTWQQAIQGFIDDSDEVIVLLSPTAKNSAFVNHEIAYALLQEKPIWAVLVKGDEKSSIPLILAGVTYEDRRPDF